MLVSFVFGALRYRLLLSRTTPFVLFAIPHVLRCWCFPVLRVLVWVQASAEKVRGIRMPTDRSCDSMVAYVT